MSMLIEQVGLNPQAIQSSMSSSSMIPRCALFDRILGGGEFVSGCASASDLEDNLRRVEEGVHVAERGTLAEFADTLRR